MERWSKDKAWEFWNNNPWMIGCNYVPKLTPGLSIWHEDTIEEILPSVHKELALMKEIGLLFYYCCGDCFIFPIANKIAFGTPPPLK